MDGFVTGLMDRMTVREKLGQLNLLGRRFSDWYGDERRTHGNDTEAGNHGLLQCEGSTENQRDATYCRGGNPFEDSLDCRSGCHTRL